MKLVLGCGNRPEENAVNHDKTKHHSYVDVAHDLDEYPWPWEDETFKLIYALDVLEHLNNLVKSLEECHRILESQGMFHLRLPHAESTISFRDPTHKWFLTPDSMNYFIRGTNLERDYGYYSPMRWKIHNFQFHGPDKENLYWVLEKDA